MEVEEFSIGVGPKLLGVKAFGDEFNLRLLPLGGYVRFPENYNATVVRQQEEQVLAAAREFDKQRRDDAGYQILNALTLGYYGDRLRKQEKQQQQIKALEKAQSSPWWRRFVGRNKPSPPTPTLVDFDDIEVNYYDNPNLLQNRPWYQRAVVLSAGVIFNLLLAFAIYFGQINYGAGVPKPIFDEGVLVSSVPGPEAAARGLLQKGDIVLKVNGQDVIVSTRPSVSETQKGINTVISTIRATPEGRSLELTVRHPGESRPVQVAVTPKRADKNSPQTIGVLLSPNYVKSEVVRSSSWTDGVLLAADYVLVLTKETAKGLWVLLGDIVSGKGAGSQVSGPIGLIKTGSEVVSTRDITTVLLFAATISINLGVVNAFPLPALDGGQLLFVLSEAVTGRKVDQRVQEGITGAALFFLLLASVGAALGDIESLFAP